MSRVVSVRLCLVTSVSVVLQILAKVNHDLQGSANGACVSRSPQLVHKFQDSLYIGVDLKDL